MNVFATALENVLTLQVLAMLCCGVLAGLLLGVVPGINGLLGLVVFAPLTIGMDVYAALALILGLIAVTTTSDTIPAVLIGVPGTGGAITTVVDGHPMARNGQAARALSAAYLASATGGIFGAGVLLVSIPVMTPLLMSLRSSDFFAISLLGLFFVAAVSGESRIKGVVAAGLGLACAQVGLHPITGEDRLTFDLEYLWSGLPLPLVLLGVFALPMLVQLSAIPRVAGAPSARLPREEMRRGLGDVLREWWLVLRCSSVGSVLGAVPGIGVIVIDWIAYSIASRHRRGGPAFGAGNVRGVIAPESANNAKDGGSLIPAIAFGLPGSAGMVILLSVLSLQGISPGTGLLNADLPVTVAMVIILVLANILGAVICLGLTPQLARIAVVPTHLLLPAALVMVTLSAFQVSLSLSDLVVLVAAGALGLLLARGGYSRPAFALGFVLGGPVERYFSLAWQIDGPALLLRPSVMIVIGLGGMLIAFSKRFNTKGIEQGFRGASRPESIILSGGLAIIGAVVMADAWRLAGPTWVLSFGIGAMVLIGSGVKALTAGRSPLRATDAAPRAGPHVAAAARVFGSVLFVTVMLFAVGPVLSTIASVLAYASMARAEIGRQEVIFAVALAVVVWALFVMLANVAFPEPWLSQLSPVELFPRTR